VIVVVRKEVPMTTLSHERHASRRPPSTLVAVLGLTQMWASLAIVVIWLAVLFTAIYGTDADLVTTSSSGDGGTVPAVAIVALFASIATWAVAKHGFRDRAD
jgi:hypothetical protein